MTKYHIAWLPGDGVGNDVMEAAKIILDTVGLDAEYIPGDVGWEFWKKEGDPLPERTIQLLKETDCCLFGAITSKPNEEAQKELDPSIKDKGFVYSSPIVRLRQLLNLHTNLRPCKAFEGNPLNYQDDIDLVVFRENTEGLYAGVEFYPVSDEIKKALKINFKDWKKRLELMQNGELLELETKHKPIYVKKIGLNKKETKEIINLSRIRGVLPEPIRVAHIIASGIKRGESYGKA